MRAVYADSALIEAMLRFEGALALAEAEHGIVPLALASSSRLSFSGATTRIPVTRSVHCVLALSPPTFVTTLSCVI